MLLAPLYYQYHTSSNTFFGYLENGSFARLELTASNSALVVLNNANIPLTFDGRPELHQLLFCQSDRVFVSREKTFILQNNGILQTFNISSQTSAGFV